MFKWGFNKLNVKYVIGDISYYVLALAIFNSLESKHSVFN